MPKNRVDEWDAVAANNLDVGGTSIAEGIPPGNMNNAMRELMAQAAALKPIGAGQAQTLTAAQQRQARANITAASGFAPGHKNKIINGDFRFWQRGNSFSASGYTADRWHLALFGGSAGTLSRVPIGIGDIQNGHNPIYGLHFARTTAGTGPVVIEHRIEDVRTLAGKRATISFVARCPAPIQIQADLYQVFGSGGTPSAQVGTARGTFTMGANFQLFQVTVDVPNIHGKILGTNENDYLALRILIPETQGTFNDLLILNVQVEEGDGATQFTPRPVAQELALCERYYQLISLTHRFDAPFASSDWYMHYPTRVVMRTAPSAVYNATVANNATGSISATGARFFQFRAQNTNAGGVQVSGNGALEAEL